MEADHTLTEQDQPHLGDVSDEQEGEEEGFTTPELPQGQELVMNILSTWGDRFYVGLTGIEVYTATGELAHIREVCVRV